MHEDDDSDDSFPGTASHGSDESDKSIDEGEIDELGIESKSSIESSSSSDRKKFRMRLTQSC